MRIDAATASLVRRRAGNACEYCLLPDLPDELALTIDHIVARQHGGGDEPENLALACGRCNQHKGPNVAGVDWLDGSVATLFHPRRQRWNRHFSLEAGVIHGRTRAGRATVATLAFNLPLRVELRRELHYDE